MAFVLVWRYGRLQLQGSNKNNPVPHLLLRLSRHARRLASFRQQENIFVLIQ